MQRKIGPCCICGSVGPLSFEHVPPRKAYNDQRVFEADIQKLVSGKWDGQQRPLQGKWAQRGAGKETLCDGCNNDTGSWYGTAYIEWARQAVPLLSVTGEKLSLVCPYTIFPLRALKQVVAMFFSACGPSLHLRFPDLVRFVLQKDTQHMPHGSHVYAYLFHPDKSEAFRQSGMTGVLKFEKGVQHVFSEIAFPPFGFILTGDSKPIHPTLLDINFMGQYSYNTREIIYLKLPVLPVVSWLPGDFRTKEGIAETVASGETVGRMNLDALR